nr:MAG TPA: hypothetical protein [Caudoviricetes sp.]
MNTATTQRNCSCPDGQREAKSLRQTKSETGVERHAQNREIKRGIAPSNQV